MYDPSGYNSGNSGNGYYPRTIDTKFGRLNIQMPRDRNGEFSQGLIPPRKKISDDLDTCVIKLYQKGITTRQISDLIEKMYGHHYSAATISNISRLVEEDVKAFHSRTVESKYSVIYCDATFTRLRRGTVQNEAVHVIIGINLEGHKEVLDYGIYPTESKENYKEMLRSLKERGLEQVLLFVTDALTGLKDALVREFPGSKDQSIKRVSLM